VEVSLDLVVEVVAVLGNGFFVLVRPGVGYPLPEQHRKDVGLEVGGVDRSAQRVGRVPQPRLKFLLGDRHRVRDSFGQLNSFTSEPRHILSAGHKLPGQAGPKVNTSRDAS